MNVGVAMLPGSLRKLCEYVVELLMAARSAM
jgi:hypothetical protein